MATGPLFSVITICLNEAGGIRRTCESVLSQTFEDFEWLAIDGGSTDGTLEILEEYADRLDILVSRPDHGIYHAMNRGAALASGEYLVFMNGGDRFFDADSLRQVAVANPTDVIIGDVQHGHDGAEFLTYPETLPPRWLLKNMLPHQAAFIRRDIFQRCGGYNEAFRIAGDYELFVRLLKVYGASYYHVSSVIAVFGSGGISQSATHRALRKRENHCVRWRYFPSYRFSFRALREAIRIARSGSTCPPATLPQQSDKV